MDFKKILKKKIDSLKLISKKTKKLSGFMIGNTSKIEKGNFYFTPLRETSSMVVSGLIVYTEKHANIAAKYIDGKVDYILVDAEKKIRPKKNGTPSNIERRIKESVKKTKILVYKGNDLTVDAVDIFLTNLLKKDLKGIGGKKILIIGVGNIGFKIALLMIERGAEVFLCARNLKNLKLKVNTLNLIKPIHTVEKVTSIKSKNLNKILKTIDIIIGATNGKAVVSKNILIKTKKEIILIDLGKGTFDHEAINFANSEGKKIYRVDISAALEGQINKLLMMENMRQDKFNKKKLLGVNIISSGLLGNYGDFVLDDVYSPKNILGICNGKGDFLRNLNVIQKQQLKKIKSYLKINHEN